MLPGQMIPAWAQPNQPVVRPQAQSTPWQAPTRMPSPASLAGGAPSQPAKARGVSAEPVSARFMLPSPEALGVTTSLSSPVQAAATAPLDWNVIQGRMDRLGVLRYQKDRLPAGGMRVLLLLPTADATKAQPVEAQADTEAAAVTLALNAAESWLRNQSK